MVFSRLSFLLLLISASLHAAADIKHSNHSDHLSNSEEDLSEQESLEPPSTIMAYMLQLRSDLTDSNGKPKLANVEDPTEVWALQDTDILQGSYRRKSKAEEQCLSNNRFLFNLESIALAHTKKQLPVEKSVLRAYMKFNPRLLETQGPTMVTIEAYMKLSERNDSEKVLASVHIVPVTAQFSQWVEINVTDAIRMLWSSTEKDPDLEITLTMRIDCQLNMRVPAIIINPATIPLSRAAKRRNKLLHQPFLVVELSDETIKDIVRNESIGTFSEGDLGMVNINDKNMTDNETRTKRGATSGCHAEEFFVDFRLIEIKYIRAPMGYNAKQCRGLCDHDFLSLNGRFGNNHAKIMAGARKLFEISQASSSHDYQFNTEPKGPCCVPTRFSSMGVIELKTTLTYTVYPSMIVEACGCR